MPSQVLNPGESPTGASCGKCALRVTTHLGGECAIVYIDGTADTRVSYEKGVCGLYIGGDRELVNNPVPTVPRSVAGYIEDSGVPTHCGNCEYYSPNVETYNWGRCAKVEGGIEFYGCCNSWESKNAK
jgi:hypothetical protein